jgi:hypothetical protein
VLRIYGFASCDGPPEQNWLLSCRRAQAVAVELETLKVDNSRIEIFANGETDQFSATTLSENRVAVVTSTTPPSPPPPPPVCPAVPTATPTTCVSRNVGYCLGAACHPTNLWLPCVCLASSQICELVDVLSFKGWRGIGLGFCVDGSGTGRPPVAAKARWFLKTNQCIWGHWRAAFDAIHDRTRAVPGGLTPEWAIAVTTCRTKGVGSKDCCRAHVTAEQTAINRCGPYPSTTFGLLPTDVPGANVPGAPDCSDFTEQIARLYPPIFTGDFGNVFDRISYGNSRCCP